MVTHTSVSARPSTIRLGSVPSHAEHDLVFLQQRLALYGATVAILSGLFVVVGVSLQIAIGQPIFADPSRPYHLLANTIPLCLWLACRQKRVYSLPTLDRLDAGATLAMSFAFAWMGYAIPGVGTLVATLAVSYVTLGRAAQVPSTPRRTLLLSAASLAFVWVSSLLGEVPPQYLTIPGGRFIAAVDPALWCIAGTSLATVTSKVIYGLQEKVIEARQLGQYTLEEKIGEGGMGEIYRARHAMLRRPTAIKLLPGDHSEDQLRRFEREVQLTASLSHPNTICVFDYGRTPEGTFYYAMELLEGLNLQSLVDHHGAQPPGRVLNLLLQVCGALAEAHSVGLIHRDLKPANIYLSRQGGIDDFVKILDFGLVRQVTNDVAVTQSSQHLLVGTPLYMSPESIAAPERIDARSDLYSLGVTAYHLLTGSPPFQGSSVVEVCGHHLHTEPESLSARLGQPIPEALEEIVLECLAKRPEGRPKNALALAGALRTAPGIARFAPEDAERWWRTVFDPRARRHALAAQRTIQVALDERIDRSREFPQAG